MFRALTLGTCATLFFLNTYTNLHSFDAMVADVASMVNVAFEAIYAILPEITMFLCALLGTVLFSGRLGNHLVDRVLVVFGLRPAPGQAKKKIMEEEDEEPPLKEKSQAQIEKEFAEGKAEKALQIWHKTRFTLVPTGTILADVVDAMLKEGAKVQDVVAELEEVVEKNPAICEGDAMECLLLFLDASKEQRLSQELMKALEEMDRLSPRLQLVQIAIALRTPTGFSDALERLQRLPENTQVPSETATKLLCVAGSVGRLPASVALLMDVDVAWASDAMDAPMLEACDRKDVELCLQLHRAAQNLGIPKTAAACVSLLRCLEENTKEMAPMALRVIAEDIVQDPFLDIDETLALALVRAGISPDDEVAIARVLGRPRN